MQKENNSVPRKRSGKEKIARFCVTWIWNVITSDIFVTFWMIVQKWRVFDCFHFTVVQFMVKVDMFFLLCDWSYSDGCVSSFPLRHHFFFFFEYKIVNRKTMELKIIKKLFPISWVKQHINFVTHEKSQPRIVNLTSLILNGKNTI